MDTTQMTRHVGKLANTDQRVIIAYMQLQPPKHDHALVIPVDNLPPRFEQAVMDVLKTTEGQQSMPFAEVLGRRLMPDTGTTILESLHRQGKLIPVPVSNILMLPKPNMPIPLADILAQQGSLSVPLQNNVSSQYENDKFNPHLANQKAETAEKKRAIARSLLRQAEEFEAIAKQKRAEAYAADPTTRPVMHDGTSVLNPAPQAMMPPMPVTNSLNINPWTNDQTIQPPVEEVFPVARSQPEALMEATVPAVNNDVAERVGQMEDRFERMETMLANFISAHETASKKVPTKGKTKLIEESKSETHEG